VKHYAWAVLRLFCGRIWPWLRGLFGLAYADHCAEIKPGYLAIDSSGIPSLVDQFGSDAGRGSSKVLTQTSRQISKLG
jgi:hypothetical protein